MDPGNRRAILAAMAANLGIALAKGVGYALTGAASMLAEALHSVADTGNQALLLWGGAAARREPTDSHPFGFGRERYFWAFVVSLVLFSLGGLSAIYEGVQKLLHPHELAQPIVAVAILSVAIVLESGSLRLAVREARRRKGSASWWEFVRHSKEPELPVVLLEDLGALLGLVFALLGIGLAAWLDQPRLDAFGSIAIGVLLIAIAVVLASEMKSLLIGEAARPEQVVQIREAILAGDQVRRIIHLRTQHLGPDQLLIATKAEFDSSLSFRELCDAINSVEQRVRARLPVPSLIYIEPDIFRDGSRAPDGDPG
jgi:cation diffusion facilitator family transporter